MIDEASVVASPERPSSELPELSLHYRYPLPSAVVAKPRGQRLRLATSGGPSPNPRFFEGQLLQPLVAADLLLTLGDVARSRFHVPPRMLQRILELADPMATCADERIRLEAFSACASVYGRVDLTPEAYQGTAVGRGTTNVDFGARLRSTLAGIGPRDELDLAIGASEVEVSTSRDTAVERRVPLPSRWLRSLLEVQAISAELKPFADLDAGAVRALLRSIPATPTKRPVWLEPVGTNVRLVHHDPGAGAPRLDGLLRLRLLRRSARHARSLRIHAADDGTTGWQLELGGARLTLLLSPEVWRGFSGEGRALHQLATAAAPAVVAEVRATLGWQTGVDVRALASATGRSSAQIDSALATLALSGLVGYDLAEGRYFRRELPFDLGRVERLQPRLHDARRLVEQGAVRLQAEGDEQVAAWVRGADGVEYQVRSTDDGWRCTCPWYGRHRGERGPCKHVLAVQLETST